MVRSHPKVVPLQLDVSRVLGWSTALALHILALMLLLIPAAYVAAPAKSERITARWVVDPPKPPDPPPMIEPLPKTPPVVTRQVTPPQSLPPPTAADTDTFAVQPLQAAEATTPTLAVPVPTPPPSGAGEGVQLQYRNAPPPAYPIAALRNHEQGTVLLRVRVETDGSASSVVIERSSGSRALDTAARQQVLRHWRFVPAKVDGQLVPADGLVPVSFSLPD
ncbi:TonB family protein [Stenotrophomonas sp.]|uniref:energy transducer TonB n=1 Tax=Stenotrophomonas sp. TaxID=69392 RepID=UPI002FCC270E